MMRQWQKIKNFTIWVNIVEIINVKQIKVQLTKVKTYTNDTYNEITDKLVKVARQEDVL